MRCIIAIILTVSLLPLTASTIFGHGDHECRISPALGFKAIHDIIPDIVGDCLQNWHYNSNGDYVQATTGGLLIRRKSDGWTAFTDGFRTWINGPHGLEERLNTQRFSWELDYAPGGAVATPTPTPIPPTPTPIPPTSTPTPTVDPTLERALQGMRKTQIGSEVADIFVQLGASAVFGKLDGSLSWVEYSSRRITINEEYRTEGYEALAHALIWPILALAFESEEGPAESWEACMERRIVMEGIQSQYWLEAFGESGKRNPTQLEQWANDELSWLVANNLMYVWMSSHYREQCGNYGSGPQIDSELAQAYVTAMQGQSELGQATVDVIVEAGTEVVFGRVSGWGAYSPSLNRITVSESLRGHSRQVLAAVLIHETYHVESHWYRGERPQATAAECLQEEVDAFRLQASWWYSQYGRYGKSRPNNVERSMNDLMRAWFNDELREWVLLSDSYQYQCLGGVVE